MIAFEEIVSLVAVGALLAALHHGINGLVFGDEPRAGRPGWRGWWYLTLWAHPIAAGALLGLVARTLPIPAGMGAGTAGRAIWFGLAGALAPVIYDAVRSLLKHRHAAGRDVSRDGGLP